MDYRKPTLTQGLFGAPNFQSMGRPELTEIMNFGTPYYAQKAQSQLARLGPQGLLGGGNFPQASPSISPQAVAMAQAAMPQLPQLQVESSERPMVSAVDEIEQASVPSSSSGLLGSIGGGLSGAASELSGLFSGEEGQARARALSKSLLSGPSATPINFGQSLAKGLAAGGEEIEAQEKRKYLKEQLEEKRSDSKARKEFKDAVESGDESKINKAFKKAYPLEWAKSTAKKETISDLKADAIRQVAFAEKNNIPRDQLPQYIIDLYESATSSGNEDFLQRIANLPDQGQNLKPIVDEKKPQSQNNPQEGTVIESGGQKYLVGKGGALELINR